MNEQPKTEAEAVKYLRDTAFPLPHSSKLKYVIHKALQALELCQQSDEVTICPSCDGFMIEGDDSAEGEDGEMHCHADCLQEMYDTQRSRSRGSY